MTPAASLSGPAAEQPSEPSYELDMRALILMLWRRKLVIVGTMLLGVSLAMVVLGFVAPRYAARSVVLIEDKGAARLAPELQNLVNYVRLDSSVMTNEVEVLRSRIMAGKVIERLNLQNDPEFKPLASAIAPPGVKTFSLDAGEPKAAPDDQPLSYAVSRFLSNLRVRSLPGSNAIEIEYHAGHPAKAAKIANAIADLYIGQRLESKALAARKLTGWLDKRLSELRGQVRASELAVQRYRQQFNLTEGARAIVSAEQLSQLNTELVKAQSEYVQTQARLNELKALTEADEPLSSSADVVASPFVLKLKEDEAALQQKLSDLSARYGERHPAMVEVKEELADLQASLQREMNTVIGRVQNEASVARAQVAALQAGIEDIVQNRQQEDQVIVGLEELEREAESNKLIFDTFLQTYKKSNEQEDLQEPEARVLSYAVPPLRPAYPDRVVMLGLAIALSLFAGLCIAILMEKLDNSFRSGGELERVTRYPCFALIPEIERLKSAASADFILSNPGSSLAESVRTLRTVLNLRAGEGQRPKVVTITSSLPGEGKSTLAGWLARLAAKSGEKVILVDADLRRPSLHKNFGRSNQVSLVEYLTGKAGLTEAIYKDAATGLHILFGKSVPGSALDLVNSRKMADMLDSLREAYDLVIIDSPACLAVSDARVLARLSDQTLFVVGWDKTPREVVLGGVKQFTDMGYDKLAFILNKVNVHRHVRYGYGDTVYYYGEDRKAG